MDLTLFLVFIIIAFMLYYLTSAIQSLIQEMREVKQKCITVHNSNVEGFDVTTPDPASEMKAQGLTILKNIKDIFSKKD